MLPTNSIGQATLHRFINIKLVHPDFVAETDRLKAQLTILTSENDEYVRDASNYKSIILNMQAEMDKYKHKQAQLVSLTSFSDSLTTWLTEQGSNTQQQQLTVPIVDHEAVVQKLNEKLATIMAEKEVLSEKVTNYSVECSKLNVLLSETEKLQSSTANSLAKQKSLNAQMEEQRARNEITNDIETIPLAEHMVIVKNLERELSKTVADNLQMKDMVS